MECVALIEGYVFGLEDVCLDWMECAWICGSVFGLEGVC